MSYHSDRKKTVNGFYRDATQLAAMIELPPFENLVRIHVMPPRHYRYR
jgi:hypothetical protein